MSAEPTREPGATRSLLGIITIAAALTLGVSLIERATREQIIANQLGYEAQAIEAVLPAGSFDNQPSQNIRLLTDADGASPVTAYIASKNAIPTAAVIKLSAPDGYVGPIDLLVSIDSSGKVIAVRISRHRETPGLGDQIEASKSAWINQFAGVDIDGAASSLKLRRDGGEIDQISGATITSRAVTNAVNRSLMIARKNRALLFADQAPAGTNLTR